MAKQRVESGTVTVACKYPTGLVLRLFNMIEVEEPLPGGGKRNTKVAQELPQRVELFGPATEIGKRPQTDIAGGYALTFNVDGQFMQKWMDDNKDSDLVKNKIVFISENASYTRDEAKEMRSVRTGLEPLNPAGDPRAPKRVEKADRKDLEELDA